MRRVPTAAIAGSIVAVAVAVVLLVTHALEGPPVAPDVRPPLGMGTTPVAPPTPDTSQGIRCIRGGTTREEVRRVMGEPDSVVFGDWLYGRSSVTFGYGVVLDYSNAGGDLVVCP